MIMFLIFLTLQWLESLISKPKTHTYCNINYIALPLSPIENYILLIYAIITKCKATLHYLVKLPT
jgi:uncharacterized protein with PQ loop repeat